MLVKDLSDCDEFIAGDGSLLRQLLHPDEVNAVCRYSLCHATVKPGQTTRPHRLKTSEVYYILEGQGLMSVDGESQAVRPGQAIYIPPHSTQHIKNTGESDLEFLCVVDPAWREENEEIL
ncbi:MAG: cupin domain-containing protein [Syntrophorhabdales bacterium]|jgi:mannose-6-phosphate isomerase-like protein (cupin superfamily)